MVNSKWRKPCPDVLVKKTSSQGDLRSQMVKQVANRQGLMDTDVAAVIELAGVQVPPLDKPLGEHESRLGKLGVWKYPALR